MEWLREEDQTLLVQLESLAREAARRAPRSTKAWLNLARLQRLLGAFADAEASLDSTSAIVRVDPLRQAELARDLAAQTEPDRALAEVDRVLAVSPHDEEMRRLRLKLLLATKRYGAAQAMVDAGEPLDPAAFGALAMLHGLNAPRDVLLARCDEALAARPHHTDALYHKAIALAQLGRRDEARALMALDTAVRIFTLPAPVGYDSGEAFRAALAEELLHNPTLVADPQYRSTRHGRQVTNPLQPDARAVIALIAQIERAVEAYAAARPGLAVPKQVLLNVWAVVLGAEGFQKSHRHPMGWLSGVFYVAAPKPPGANAWPGRLVVGKVDGDLTEAASSCWDCLEIEPVPGRLVLFPSHIPHATEPSGIDADRISVAFDVVPLRW